MDQILIAAPAPSLTMILTPHWAAMDKGFFREEELQVTSEYVPRKNTDNIWASPEYKDRLVFWMPGGHRPFHAAKDGWQEINIICTQDRPYHIFIARPEIETVADLKGKRIIAAQGGTSYIDTVAVLKHFGLDPKKDVTWLEPSAMPGSEVKRLEAISRGEADAMATEPPNWTIGLKMGLRRLPSARDFEVRPSAGLSTSPGIIKERPDVVKRVVRALIRGTEFVRLNKEETLDIVQRHIPFADRDTLSSCYDSIHHDWYVVGDEGPYAAMAEIYKANYGLKHQPLENYIVLSFVREALEELRLIRRPFKS